MSPTAAPRFIAYRRVSTAEQGKSGLGLEAQAAAIAHLVANRGGRLIADFEEVQTGKGADALDRRPVLAQALKAAKAQRATLVVSRLDRLSRNLHFVSGLLDQGADLLVADMPQADKRMLQVFAMVGEWERDAIAGRISAALQAKKARGGAVGNPASLQPFNGARATQAAAAAEKLRPTLQAYQARGMTQRAMVEALNGAGVPTANGGQWSLVQVQRVLSRLPMQHSGAATA
jgi:DNA invertase Pin-like site-specific DNA recombinase